MNGFLALDLILLFLLLVIAMRIFSSKMEPLELEREAAFQKLSEDIDVLNINISQLVEDEKALMKEYRRNTKARSNHLENRVQSIKKEDVDEKRL